MKTVSRSSTIATSTRSNCSSGVFLMTPQLNSQDDAEFALGKQLVDAAVEAGAGHIVFSTLENVEKVSSGKKHVPHFTNKALVADYMSGEDPVTGSFNAGAAQWLIGSHRAPRQYVAAQGTVLGRAGRIHVTADDGDIWVGGYSTTCINGSVLL